MKIVGWKFFNPSIEFFNTIFTFFIRPTPLLTIKFILIFTFINFHIGVSRWRTEVSLSLRMIFQMSRVESKMGSVFTCHFDQVSSFKTNEYVVFFWGQINEVIKTFFTSKRTMRRLTLSSVYGTKTKTVRSFTRFSLSQLRRYLTSRLYQGQVSLYNLHLDYGGKESTYKDVPSTSDTTFEVGEESEGQCQYWERRM